MQRQPDPRRRVVDRDPATGHGTVALPADYVRAHVRLGYAATEHGYQSDTVTTGIALTSSTTTRRSLYVAATRGRDRNELCVITDSNDITEARDVLEGVLALDRADVPTVTQRRTLAEQDRHARPHRPVEPERQPRCPIPEWFQPLLDAARRDRDDVERRLSERQVRRDERLAEVGSAEARLRRVDERTRPDRTDLADSSSRLDQARRRRDDAGRRLHGSGRRGRRQARRELAVTEDRLDQADARLKGVDRRTAPAVATYQEACDGVRQATDAVRDHDLVSQLGRPDRHSIELSDRVTALETWGRWAEGGPINVDDLAAAVQALNDPRLRSLSPGYGQLGQTVTLRASDSGLERQLVPAPTPTVRHSGLELEL